MSPAPSPSSANAGWWSSRKPRIHAARNQNNQSGSEILLPELFTAEPYSRSEHTWEREQGYLWPVVYYKNDEEMFFGIGPAFVAARMRGGFGGATVVMMGCNGLISGQMAEAFIRRGAGAFVSWDDLVSVAHTDAATLNLVRHMLVDYLSPADAAAATMADVGPDPSTASCGRIRRKSRRLRGGASTEAAAVPGLQAGTRR